MKQYLKRCIIISTLKLIKPDKAELRNRIFNFRKTSMIVCSNLVHESVFSILFQKGSECSYFIVWDTFMPLSTDLFKIYSYMIKENLACFFLFLYLCVLLQCRTNLRELILLPLISYD